MPAFPKETRGIRKIIGLADYLKDLQDRRVEITGYVDRKMIINALNSGASTFMADFEDSNAPTWENCMEGQINLSDAINRTIDFVNEEGKSYQLGDEIGGAFGKTSRFTFRRKKKYYNKWRKSFWSLIDFRIYFFSEMRKNY